MVGGGARERGFVASMCIIKLAEKWCNIFGKITCFTNLFEFSKHAPRKCGDSGLSKSEDSFGTWEGCDAIRDFGNDFLKFGFVVAGEEEIFKKRAGIKSVEVILVVDGK